MMTRQEKRRARFTEEIVLQKGTQVSQRLIAMGRERDAQAVLAASVLVSDILATEYGRAPRPDAGLVWNGPEARYVANKRAEDLDSAAGIAFDEEGHPDAPKFGVHVTTAERITTTTTERVTHRSPGPPSYIQGLSPEELDAEYAQEGS